MTHASRHISEWFDRPASDVYEFASDPANLPAWASGLGSTFELIDGEWSAESSMGRVTLAFAPANDFGVLDHDVTLPSGETVYNPMRVIADGSACEVIFTLRRTTGMTDDDFESDAAAVASDLAALRRLLEVR